MCAQLIARADVFLHNLAPGAVERLGLGYDELAARHPRLVWCGISGYGPDGPYRDKKAYDLLVQAESGVVSLTGTPESPAKVGISIADISSGMYAYSSILAALYARERTGRGQRIDISMLECLTEWMMPPMYVWMGTGEMPPRAGLRHNMIAPYGAYQCADGAVLFGIQNEREWVRFCGDVLDSPIAADRFPGNADTLRKSAELDAIIEADICKTHACGSHRASRPRRNRQRRHEQHRRSRRSIRSSQRAIDGPKRDSPVGPIRALIPPHNLHDAPPAHGPRPGLRRTHARSVGGTRMIRSMLFVPASRPDMIEKALKSAADAVCIDLEDSVAPADKPAARANVAETWRCTPGMRSPQTTSHVPHQRASTPTSRIAT